MLNLASWLEEKLHNLNLTDTMELPDGFSRLSFSKEEKEAHHQFRKIARELELNTYQDEAGNQWAVWEVDKKAPTIAVGSHLDTVHNGGGYDGVAGVLCALAAVKALKNSQFLPTKNIAIICFVSEESARFGLSTIGSKAIAGTLDKGELASIKDRDGVTAKQAMESFGINWKTIEQAVKPVEELESFVELHIEQGTQIEGNNADIGVVSGVACPVRLKITVSGMANHTGTTPMNNRQDAFVAIAPLVNFVSDEAMKIDQTGERSLVATVSTIHLKPNAMNVIPGEVELGIDIRSVDDVTKRDFAEKIKDYCSEIKRKHHVNIEITTLVDNDSVLLNSEMQYKLVHACSGIGLQAHVMDSGAGHDVMNMATKWPSGLIFIPCRNGLSHHPDEFASIDDMVKGTRVLVEFLRMETAGL
ncbi:M20 family metallo-hydrolase [Virgibacillus ndiopensis]|uniref:M20 family metallo-hydrolase n=1 Tax=Virgibacillus ndiopensis TaxID=2004408 RepID=UPI000C068320|nr:M20 family metallo-hydrolase [Virgibacillus ndiopensis]